MTDIQFPAVLDSTIFKSYKRCPRSFWHGHVEGKRLEDGSIHLHAGKAFASAVEAARNLFYGPGGHTADEAILEGLDALAEAYGPERPYETKSLKRLEEALEGYFKRFPLSFDEGIVPLDLGVESKFSFPIPGLRHPDTGEPLLYAGRRDMIGVDKSTADPFGTGEEDLWMVDEKTGGYINEGWQHAFELDWQFLGYAYYERFIAGNPIKGVEIRKGCLTRKEYDAKKDWAAGRITYTDELLKEWYKEMVRTANDMLFDYRGNYIPEEEYASGESTRKNAFQQTFGDACNAFTGCDFKPICRHTVQPNYIIYHWNPLAEEEEK